MEREGVGERGRESELKGEREEAGCEKEREREGKGGRSERKITWVTVYTIILINKVCPAIKDVVKNCPDN